MFSPLALNRHNSGSRSQNRIGNVSRIRRASSFILPLTFRAEREGSARAETGEKLDCTAPAMQWQGRVFYDVRRGREKERRARNLALDGRPTQFLPAVCLTFARTKVKMRVGGWTNEGASVDGAVSNGRLIDCPADITLVRSRKRVQGLGSAFRLGFAVAKLASRREPFFFSVSMLTHRLGKCFRV